MKKIILLLAIIGSVQVLGSELDCYRSYYPLIERLDTKVIRAYQANFEYENKELLGILKPIGPEYSPKSRLRKGIVKNRLKFKPAVDVVIAESERLHMEFQECLESIKH